MVLEWPRYVDEGKLKRVKCLVVWLSKYTTFMCLDNTYRNVCAARVVLCETAQGPLCEDVTVVGALEPSSLFKKTLVTDERLDAHGRIPHCLPHAI